MIPAFSFWALVAGQNPVILDERFQKHPMLDGIRIQDLKECVRTSEQQKKVRRLSGGLS